MLFTLNCRNGIMSWGPVGTKPGSRTRLRSTIWGPILHYITCCKLNLSPIFWLVMGVMMHNICQVFLLPENVMKAWPLSRPVSKRYRMGCVSSFWNLEKRETSWASDARGLMFFTHRTYTHTHERERERSVFWCLEISSHIWPFQNWDQ